MPTQQSSAVWEGNLKEGRGTIKIGQGPLEAPYGYASRFEGQQPGTNPEELLGAAHAGCFSMALANELTRIGHPPTKIETVARVQLTKGRDGYSIPAIELETEVDSPGIEEDVFHRAAYSAKENCPVSKLFSGAKITLNARLLSQQKA